MKSGFGIPFDLQVDFLRRKLDLPTETWTDVWRSAHDRAFMVAGAMKADLVADLHAAVIKAAAEGLGIDAFRKDFNAIVARHGWTGWTGEGSKGGYAWRTRTIYQTNMATSYAAGRWAQVNDPALAKFRPYIKYHHADGVRHPRPLHVSWNGLVLPKDHPFWKTHAPPNGWGCHCYVTAAGPKDYAAAEAAGKAAPPAGWGARNDKTGAPVGIDQGFDYAPGANVDTALRDMVADKLISHPAAISRALAHDLNRYVMAHRPPSEFASIVLAQREIQKSVAFLGFVEDGAALEAAAGRELRGYIGVIPADAPRHIETSHKHDGGSQRPIKPADYDQVWGILNGADDIKAGHATERGLDSVVATKAIGGEIYRAVFEVRPGRRNRTLALISLVVKRL